FQAEDGIRDRNVTGVQTCALPILRVLPGSMEISNYGTRIDLKAEFSVDGVAYSIPLTANRLTDKEMNGIRASFPWFQDPYYPFEIGRASCRESVWMLR